jgi:hypothetical protein
MHLFTENLTLQVALSSLRVLVAPSGYATLHKLGVVLAASTVYMDSIGNTVERQPIVPG